MITLKVSVDHRSARELDRTYGRSRGGSVELGVKSLAVELPSVMGARWQIIVRRVIRGKVTVRR